MMYAPPSPAPIHGVQGLPKATMSVVSITLLMTDSDAPS